MGTHGIKCTVQWMPVEIGPGSTEQSILYCTRNGKLGVFKELGNGDWKWLCEKYGIKYWTYQNEIVPPEFR